MPAEPQTYTPAEPQTFTPAEPQTYTPAEPQTYTYGSVVQHHNQLSYNPGQSNNGSSTSYNGSSTSYNGSSTPYNADQSYDRVSDPPYDPVNYQTTERVSPQSFPYMTPEHLHSPQPARQVRMPSLNEDLPYYRQPESNQNYDNSERDYSRQRHRDQTRQHTRRDQTRQHTLRDQTRQHTRRDQTRQHTRRETDIRDRTRNIQPSKEHPAEPTWNCWYPRLKEEFFHLLIQDLPPMPEILELYSGDGSHIQNIKAQSRVDSYVGIEPRKDAYERSNSFGRRLKGRSTMGCMFYNSDMSDGLYWLNSQRFHCIFALEGMEQHFNSLGGAEKIFGELSRLLTPKGSIVLLWQSGSRLFKTLCHHATGTFAHPDGWSVSADDDLVMQLSSGKTKFSSFGHRVELNVSGRVPQFSTYMMVHNILELVLVNAGLQIKDRRNAYTLLRRHRLTRRERWLKYFQVLVIEKVS